MGDFMNSTRTQFTHSSILEQVSASFNAGLPALLTETKKEALHDALMSSLAIFAMKYPSLLSFERDKAENPCVENNLKSLYHVKKTISDTYLRQLLDDSDLSIVQGVFPTLFSVLQRSKVLEQWRYLNNKYLVNLDATGFFSSNSIHCSQCCEKVSNKGTEQELVM